MSSIRKIKRISKSIPTIEGAGVRLKRAFGNNDVPLLDPFLLLDDFHSDDPDDYIQGFPWHPHRGIETITYVLDGDVEHGDSMGNKGDISSGDVQWMTAGSGIIHQEMPKGTSNGVMWGFQLWANLPASQKMIDPRYRDVTKEIIPEVTLVNGVKIKIIAGNAQGTEGPVRDIVIDPEYLDITVPPETVFSHDTKKGHTVVAYTVDGYAFFDSEKQRLLDKENLVIYEDGDSVHITSTDEPVRFLLISGKPLNEPVAWHGPIVMNTNEELEQAFEEYRSGTFIK